MTSPIAPVPADFLAIAPTLSQRGLAKHYHVSRDLISRWVAETGVRTSRARPDRRSTKPPKPVFKVIAQRSKVQHDDMRHMTMYDEAADVIRRERFVVYRCGPTGAYLEKGLHWRVGNAILTPDELLERADRYRRRSA